MKNPKVEFITNDLRSQAEYISFLAKQIERGFYQSKGFLVLPYVLPRDPLSVHFPDLPYSTGFWQEIGKCKNEDLGRPFPKICVEEVLSHLPRANQKNSAKIDKKIISQWRPKEKKFFELAKEFLDSQKLLAKLTLINFLLTDFGTRGSFFSYQTKKGIKVMATFRRDFPLAEIGKTLLLCFYLIKKGRAISPLDWERRQATIHFLFTETAFAKLFPDYQPPKGFLDHQKAEKLVTESQAFLAKLGFPPQSIVALGSSQNIIINQKDLTGLFTPQEKTALQLLVERRNKLVSYDQLAEAIWEKKADDKFSLYALSKLIENVRRKLRQANINQNLILTARRQGYLLYD